MMKNRSSKGYGFFLPILKTIQIEEKKSIKFHLLELFFIL